MKIGEVVAALNSDLRREILQIVSKQPMTVKKVLEELDRRNIKTRYRETVYRALEKLLDAGLVKKYYRREKGLCYEITTDRIVIDLTRGTLDKV